MDSERLLLSKVEAFIKEHEMLRKDVPILVGISGGADSTALLNCLVSLGYTCEAAHCNFQLRGDESMRDNEFAEMQAKSLGVRFHQKSFNAKEFARHMGMSIEMACRELRYKWFSEVQSAIGAQGVAVAHHTDDSVETFFLNLLRGTGIAGLTGINPINGAVVRPFLSVTREEIDKYLKEKNIDYITDSSNLEDIYQRNKIRNQLIPMLKSITPAASESILKTMKNLQEVQAIYDEHIRNGLSRAVTFRGTDFVVSIPVLMQEVAPKTLLFEFLKTFDASSAMCEDVFKSLNGVSGKSFYTGTARILKDRDVLIVSQKTSGEDVSAYYIEQGETSIRQPREMQFEVMEYFPGFIIPETKESVCFDADLLSWPLKIRHWERGDKFVPFGMRGAKKLSDYFSDHKYSLIEKEKAWLLLSGDDIIWLIGERIDNRFRVTSKTKRVLMVTLSDHI